MGARHVLPSGPVDERDHSWSDVTMNQVRIADLKAHLSRYLARVRKGDSVVICDRQTPIARLVPIAGREDEIVLREPPGSTADLKNVRGVTLKRDIDVMRVLRESRGHR